MNNFFFYFALVIIFINLVIASCPNDCSSHGSCSNNICTCNSGYAGVDCSVVDTTLNSGQTRSSEHVDQREWHYYNTHVRSSGSIVTYTVNQKDNSDGDCDLYVKFGDYPTRGSYDARDISTANDFSVVLDEVDAGTIYAGVYGYKACDYSISVSVSGSCGNNCNNHGSCVSGECSCNDGWSGEFCEVEDESLKSGKTVSGRIDSYSWKYYYIDAEPTWTLLQFKLVDKTSQSDCDLYVKIGDDGSDSQPTLFSWDYSNITTDQTSTIDISEVVDDRYNVGVYGYKNCDFELTTTVEQAESPSDCSNNCSLHGTCSQYSCHCHTGYSGQDCETYYNKMTLDTKYHGFVGDSAWNYFHVTAFTANPLVVHVEQLNDNADCDVYIRDGQNPTRFQYDYLDISSDEEFTVEIAEPADDTWYIGLYGWFECEYNIWVDEAESCTCTSSSHGKCIAGSNLCVCNDDWVGEFCDQQVVSLTSGSVKSGSLSMNEWTYYHITTTSTYFEIVAKEEETQGFLWLFVTLSESSEDAIYPDLQEYDEADMSLDSNTHMVTFDHGASEQWHYVIGVYGNMYDQGSRAIPYKIVAWSPPY